MQDSKRNTERQHNKKRILFACFLVAILALFIVLSVIFTILRENNPKGVTSVDEALWSLLDEPENTVDLVVVGDSESLGMLMPRRLFNDTGITSYLSGAAGQTIAESYYAFRYIFKKQSPNVAILESNLITETPRRNEPYQALQNTVEYYLPIFRLHNVWAYLCGNQPEYVENDMGWVSRPAIKPYVGDVNYMSPDSAVEPYNIPYIRKVYLKKIKEICEENDVQLLVVTMPTALNFNNAKLTAIQEELGKQGIDYLDLNSVNDQVGIDWSVDTPDCGDHVNDTGTIKVMNYLEGYLVQNYDMPDHREDSNYDKWR